MEPIAKLNSYINSSIPYAWDDSESWYEFLGKVLAKVNELVTASNDYFAVDLEAYTLNLLSTWIEDGTLKTIINNSIVNTKADIAWVNLKLDEVDDKFALMSAANAGNKTLLENTMAANYAALDTKIENLSFGAGGVYPINGIPVAGVKIENLDLKTGDNLITKDDIVEGFYYSDTGVKTALETMSFVKVPVTPGEFVTVYSNFTGITPWGVFVNNADAYVIGIKGTQYHYAENITKFRVFKVPNNTIITHVYINILTTHANINQVQVVKTLNKKISKNNQKISSALISDDIIKKDNDAVLSNLFNASLSMDGVYYQGSTNRFMPAETLAMCPPIELSSNTTLVVKNMGIGSAYPSNFGAWFSQTGENLGNWVVSGQMSGSTTPPENAKYFLPVFSVEAAPLVEIYLVPLAPKTKLNRMALYPQTADAQKLAGKKWVSDGDSVAYLNNWQPEVAAYFGLIHTTTGLGSTTVSGTQPNALWQTVRINAVKAENPDILTVLSGFNDALQADIIGSPTDMDANLGSKNTSTFYGAYSHYIETLLTWKPSLKIVLMQVYKAHNDAAVYPTSYTQISEAITQIAEYYSLPVVPLFSQSGFNKYTFGNAPYNVYSNDNIHPNTEGAKVISALTIDIFKRL